ncbi:unnamed protein product [Caenorhabditis brenneri]
MQRRNEFRSSSAASIELALGLSSAQAIQDKNFAKKIQSTCWTVGKDLPPSVIDFVSRFLLAHSFPLSSGKLVEEEMFGFNISSKISRGNLLTPQRRDDNSLSTQRHHGAYLSKHPKNSGDSYPGLNKGDSYRPFCGWIQQNESTIKKEGRRSRSRQVLATKGKGAASPFLWDWCTRSWQSRRKDNHKGIVDCEEQSNATAKGAKPSIKQPEYDDDRLLEELWRILSVSPANNIANLKRTSYSPTPPMIRKARISVASVDSPMPVSSSTTHQIINFFKKSAPLTQIAAKNCTIDVKTSPVAVLSRSQRHSAIPPLCASSPHRALRL